jgi:hypothetical protein
VRVPAAGVEQAQVVVDHRDGADVERGLRLVDFWSIETAGDRPSMKSTSGLSIWPEELPGVGDSDST